MFGGFAVEPPVFRKPHAGARIRGHQAVFGEDSRHRQPRGTLRHHLQDHQLQVRPSVAPRRAEAPVKPACRHLVVAVRGPWTWCWRCATPPPSTGAERQGESWANSAPPPPCPCLSRSSRPSRVCRYEPEDRPRSLFSSLLTPSASFFQSVSGLRLKDTFLKRTYEYDDIAQVCVICPYQSNEH